MTTTVTITTHGWPARVTITDNYVTGLRSVHHVDSYVLPRWSEQQLHLTDTRSLAFDELTAEGWKDKPAETSEPASDAPPAP